MLWLVEHLNTSKLFLSDCMKALRNISVLSCLHSHLLFYLFHKPYQTIISRCFMIVFVFSVHSLNLALVCLCFPLASYLPSLHSYFFLLLLCAPSLLLSTELLGHHRPKASQTTRQATDAIHAVQPEGKQEGKTPIHGVCFYCLSSHPPEKLAGVWGWETAKPWRLTTTSAT